MVPEVWKNEIYTYYPNNNHSSTGVDAQRPGTDMSITIITGMTTITGTTIVIVVYHPITEAIAIQGIPAITTQDTGIYYGRRVGFD